MLGGDVEVIYYSCQVLKITCNWKHVKEFLKDPRFHRKL